MNEKFYDKNNARLNIGDTIKDDMATYCIELGSFEREDGDEVIAVSTTGAFRKLLSPERTRAEFELVND